MAIVLLAQGFPLHSKTRQRRHNSVEAGWQWAMAEVGPKFPGRRRAVGACPQAGDNVRGLLLVVCALFGQLSSSIGAFVDRPFEGKIIIVVRNLMWHLLGRGSQLEAATLCCASSTDVLGVPFGV